ncbi:polymer-forming cytoskeletal protein [Natronomonas sp.]|uniref:polymer-forming cytoskeletal protein n=1 Tax=Natronomonas sp. TaxID=2184060 RepID=UPI002FC36200
MTSGTRRRVGVLLLAVVLVVSLVPGLAAAQSNLGGNIVVEEGETVSEVNAVGGAVIIRGTVTGDVSGAAGSVLVTGTVEGDVNVATGDLRIAGNVGGDVSAAAGRVYLEEGATVDGNFDVGTGDARIDGTIGGDARIGAETIRLGDTASIGGSLTYDGRLQGNRDAVAGDITRDRTLGPTTVTELRPLASWVTAVYAFVANLLLGGILLALFPRFSEGVADRVRTDSVRTGLVGLGVLVGVPLGLVAITLTIVGIPLAFVGALLFLFVIWIGLVYGRFALGVWLLSVVAPEREGTETDNEDRFGGVDPKWVALVVGLLAGGLLALLPVVGELINLLLGLLGLGAVALGVYGRRRQRGPLPTDAPAEGAM